MTLDKKRSSSASKSGSPHRKMASMVHKTKRNDEIWLRGVLKKTRNFNPEQSLVVIKSEQTKNLSNAKRMRFLRKIKLKETRELERRTLDAQQQKLPQM